MNNTNKKQVIINIYYSKFPFMARLGKRSQKTRLNIQLFKRTQVIMRPQDSGPCIDTSDEAANYQAAAQRQAARSVTVSSSEPLELTLTRSGIEVYNTYRESILWYPVSFAVSFFRFYNMVPINMTIWLLCISIIITTIVRLRWIS